MGPEWSVPSLPEQPTPRMTPDLLLQDGPGEGAWEPACLVNTQVIPEISTFGERSYWTNTETVEYSEPTSQILSVHEVFKSPCRGVVVVGRSPPWWEGRAPSGEWEPEPIWENRLRETDELQRKPERAFPGVFLTAPVCCQGLPQRRVDRDRASPSPWGWWRKMRTPRPQTSPGASQDCTGAQGPRELEGVSAWSQCLSPRTERAAHPATSDLRGSSRSGM